MENAKERPEGRSIKTSWQASASSEYARRDWTVRYLAQRELVHGDPSQEITVPNVDQLAADVVVLLGPRDAIRYAKKVYAAFMRAAGERAA